MYRKNVKASIYIRLSLNYHVPVIIINLNLCIIMHLTHIYYIEG